MATPTDMTLQHANVNGAIAVALKGATLSYEWKNIGGAKPVQSKFDIAEADYTGFENPVIKVTGTIDIDVTTSNVLTQSLLLDFAQQAIDLKLTVFCAGQDSILGVYLKGRPVAGYSIAGTYTDYVMCFLVGFSLNFGVPDSKEGRIWTYVIELQETA
jgi:hypothetical protein